MPKAEPNRRRFLKLGLAGGALLALGGLAMRGTTQVAASGPLVVLNPTEFSIVHALAETCVVVAHGLPSPADLGVAEAFDALLHTMHPTDVADVKKALGLLENALAGFVLGGRTTTFTGASPQARAHVLESWRDSRVTLLRSAYRALVGLVLACYWADPRSYAAAGYPGPRDYGYASAQ